MNPMTSSRPYLIRAIYEWLSDNQLTPHLAVDATQPRVDVPGEHVKDGQIVLNVSQEAVRDLHIDGVAVTFSARFSGKVHHIYVPVLAVLAVYAAENGRGMVFSEDEPSDDEPPGDSGKGGDSHRGSHLRVLK